MNKRVLKNVATFTLMAFMATPLYGLVQAASNASDTSDEPKTYIEFEFKDTMDVNVTNREGGIMMMASGDEATLNFNVTIGEDKTQAIDYVAELRSLSTGNKIVIDGANSQNITVPTDTYTVCMVKLPNGATTEQLGLTTADVVVGTDTTSIDVALSSGFGRPNSVRVQSKTIGADGKYSQVVGECTYNLEREEADGTWTVIGVMHTDAEGAGVATVNSGSYRTCIMNHPDQYDLSEAMPYTTAVEGGVLQALFYLDPKADAQQADINLTVTNDGAPLEGAVIKLVKENTNVEYTLVTDDQGKATLSAETGKFNITCVSGVKDAAPATKAVDVTGTAEVGIEFTGLQEDTTDKEVTISAMDGDTALNLTGYIEEQVTGTTIKSFKAVNGSAVISLPASGHYVARVLSTNYTGNQRAFTFDYEAGTPVTVEIQAHPNEDNYTRLIKLSVKGDDGNVVRSASFTFTDAYGQESTHVINDAEFLEIPITGNTYTVVMNSVDRNYTVNAEPFTIRVGNADVDLEVPVEKIKEVTYPINIKAVDALGVVMKDATIKLTLTGTAQEYQATSEENGEFSLSLPEGTYDVELVGVVGMDNASGKKVQYVHKKDAPVMEYLITDGIMYNFTIEVLDETGTPKPGVAVEFRGTLTRSETTPSNGIVNFTVPAGTYTYCLTNLSESYVPVCDVEEIKIGPDQTKNKVTINLVKQTLHNLTVNVKDKDNQPVQGMDLSFYQGDNQTAVRSIYTDANGTGTVIIPQGEYVMKNVSIAEGYNKIPDQTVVVKEDTTLDVTAEKASVDAKTGTITLTVKDKEGNPVQLVQMGLYRKAGADGIASITPDYTASTNEEGKAVATVEAGTYDVKILSAPTGFVFDGSVIKTVTVTAGNSASGDITEGVIDNDDPNPNPDEGDKPNPNPDGTTGTLYVKILNNGSPLEGVSFRLTGPDGTSNDYVSNAEPIAIIKEAGAYKVTILSLPDGYAMSGNASAKVDVVKGGTASLTFNMEKASGGNTDDVTNERGNLTVTAIFNGGYVPSIGFSLYDLSGQFVASGTTDSDGVVRFGSLRAGTYTLNNTSVTNGYELVPSQKVIVVADRTINQNVIITMKDNNSVDPDSNYGSVVVTLLDRNGVGINDAEYTLYDYDEKVDTAVTDDYGKAVFTDVTPGTYYIVQTKAGYSSSRALERKQISVTRGQATSLSYTTPAGRGYEISGFVFEDINANGIWESKQDDLYKGAKVQLLDEDGDLLLETKTNSDGEWRFDTVPNGDYSVKLLKIKGYDYIDKHYGTNRDSSCIDKRGECTAYVDGEDEDEYIMGIVSTDLTLNPVMGSGTNNNVNNNNSTSNPTYDRFPTLSGNENNGLLGGIPQTDGANSGNPAGDGVYHDGLYEIEYDNSTPNSTVTPNGEDKVSNLPHTGDNGYAWAAGVYMLFMFIVLVTFRRFIVNKLM